MWKKLIACLAVILAVALYIGIPKLIPDEPYDLSDVPRFYAANGYSKYLNHSTGHSFGPVRAPSDAIDYAASYRLAQYDAEFDVGYETAYRSITAYYDPVFDLWMVYDCRNYAPTRHTTVCFPGPDMDSLWFLTFIRGSDGMILAFLPTERPEPLAFQPPNGPHIKY